MNLPLSGFVSEVAHPSQRGFVRGRHILDNVVQLESEALIASSTSTTTPLMLAFDLEAALPSVSHRFMWAVLKQYGIPRSFRNVLKGLYNDHKSSDATWGHTLQGVQNQVWHQTRLSC